MSEHGDYEANIDLLTDEVMEALRKLDDGAYLGSGLVRDPTKKLPVDQMESEHDTASRPANRWRSEIYDHGEFDKSDLSKPPSPKNPHPFDPSTLPPTHAHSLAAYVNHIPVLQRLLDLGVDLLEVDKIPKLGRHLVRLQWKNDAQPKIYWLVKQIGVPIEDVGSYLTRNPYFLLQQLEDMKAWSSERVAYLRSKKFKQQDIVRIVTEYRFWLNTDVKAIDTRLGWIQRQFRLNGDERMVVLFNNDLGFAPPDLRHMVLEDPRLLLMDPKPVTVTFNYLTRVMGLSNEKIRECPMTLRCPVASIRKRHEFLRFTKKAQYEPELPDHVPLKDLIHPSDAYFAEKVARQLHFTFVMAQSVPPGDITTQPGTKIVFNAPYDDKHTYHIKIINAGGRRIGWAIKTTNMKRLGVDPPCGVLDPKEAVLMAVSCDSFQFGSEDTNNDRITIEWTNTPDGAAKQFRREWFQGDGMVRRKNLPIEYNP
ncbi:Major sperm protein [Aphelenchoides avenae]|nr:Major sperm protein [Aphelenchus avenae]